jgi:TP901 family phage tail tape measure protein
MSSKTIEAVLKLSAKMGDMKALKTLERELGKVDRQAKAFNRSQGVFARGTMAAYGRMARFAGPAVLAAGAVAATKRFAEVERRMTRIGVTAEASADKTKVAFAGVSQIAQDLAVPIDNVVSGLDSLVASGRSLDEAMKFLPAVTATAQASGAEIVDIATTADAVGQHLKITAEGMQGAFDIMAAAGKQGKFELKDMAQYLPSLAPQFARVGYEGEAGLRKLVAALQTVRQYTGSSGEAATALENVLNKMGSEETAKKFANMGVKDLRGELDAARKSGKDVLNTFIELTKKATKGDMSKLPLLFTDAQFLQGMNALVQGADATNDMAANLSKAAGTVKNDLARVLDDNQAKIDQLANSWDRFLTSLGAASSGPVGSVLDKMTETIAWNSGIEAAKTKRGMAWYDTIGMGNTQLNGLAWEGGYRSPEDKKLISAYGQYGTGRVEPFRVPDRPTGEPQITRHFPHPPGLVRANSAGAAYAENYGAGVDVNRDEFLAAAAAAGDEISQSGAEAGQNLGSAANDALAAQAARIGAQIGAAAAAAISGARVNVDVTGRVSAGPAPAARVNADTGRSGADVKNWDR